MLKDNWEEKHGVNLPGHPTCAEGIQGIHVGNMMIQPSQDFSDKDYLAGSLSRRKLTASAPSGSLSECSILRQSNLQVGNSLLVLNGQGNRCSEPKFVDPVSIRHRFDNEFYQQNHISETNPTFNASCGNGIEKIGDTSHNMVSQLQPSLLAKTIPVTETFKPIDNVCSQAEAHKLLLSLKPYSTNAEKSSLGSNLQELIKLLSTSHGLPMQVPLEMGSSECLRVVEILQQHSVQPNGFSDRLNGRGSSQEAFSGGSKPSGSCSIVGGASNTQRGEIASLGPSVSTGQDEISRRMPDEGQFAVATDCFGNRSESINGGWGEETIKVKEMTVTPSTEKPELALAEDESSLCRDTNKEKIIGYGQKTDPVLGPLKVDEKKMPSEKTSRIVAEKLWDGSLQLSSSVTLSAVAFFKSGEKLLGNNWPEFIEVKGKVRLEAFEKYVQDLPRSRNRGLMVVSLCLKDGSSDTGLTGMKEVAKGYKRSSRVGFAQLLSGIDLYICPRSDPIITILAKYGFFKGLAVIDDKQDSMIGCVVWRKNRPLNPVGNTSDSKIGSNSVQPQNSPSELSIKQGAEKKLSPECVAPESSQHDEPVIVASSANCESSKNITSVEVDYGGNSSSNSNSLQSSVSSDPCLVRKRPFEDDDLPEFDFGIACVNSTVVSHPLNPVISRNNRLASVNCQKLDNSRLTQFPSVNQEKNNAVARNTSNGSLVQSSKKTKLFDDDDDMPEWCPPELHNKIPPQSTTSKLQNLPLCPPRPPPIPPPPPADPRPSLSYQPFRPPNSCPPTTFLGTTPPPLPPSTSSGGFNSNQALRHRPSPSNVNPSFPSSNGRRPRP